MKLVPNKTKFQELDEATQKKFEAKLTMLFGSFEAFWNCNRKYGFRISHQIETNDLHVVRARECVNCGVETFSHILETPEAVNKEKSKTATILCETCASHVENSLMNWKPR